MRHYLKRAIHLIKFEWELLGVFLWDYKRYRKHAAPSRRFSNDYQRRAFLLMLLHAIEKGMALPHPQGYYGADKIKLIFNTYQSIRFGKDSEWLKSYTYEVLNTYLNHLVKHGEAPENHVDSIRRFLERMGAHSNGSAGRKGGIKLIQFRQLPRWQTDALIRFFETRHSVRDFREGSIRREDMLLAVRMAHAGPFACNRRPYRVHFIEPGTRMDQLLSFQNGNRGFGDHFAAIAVVTTDLSSCLSPEERNQPWVEGGLFSMSLMLAFHAMGYGTCSLNWAAGIDQDKAIRATGIISQRECVIMYIGIGLLKESFYVASSARCPVEQITVFHE